MALDIAPSLAKVRVDGSNPFARSNSSHIGFLDPGGRFAPVPRGAKPAKSARLELALEATLSWLLVLGASNRSIFRKELSRLGALP